MSRSSADTSIPRSTRVVVIIQLSLVFWLGMSACIKPFMSDYWVDETVENLYRIVMGDVTLLDRIEDPPESLRERLARNAERFEALGEARKREYQSDYASRRNRPGRSMGEAANLVMQILFRDLSPFMQAWMLFSLIVCVLLLLRIEGSPQASWLLLLLAILYVGQNWRHGLEAPDSPDTALIPSEEVISNDYLKAPLEGSASEQQEQLRKGWHLYLVDTYLGEAPAADDAFEKQVERAEWLFLLKRLDTWRAYQSPSVQEQLRVRHSPLFLVLAVCWHLFFSYWVTRKNAIIPEYFQDMS